MNKAALTFALALLPCASAAAAPLTVWIPEQGQTATLSAAGLVGAAGNRIRLDTDYTSPQEKPILGGFARLTYGTKTSAARLEVVQGGNITASYQFAAGHPPNALWGTVRGPCVTETDNQGKSPALRCFAPDLKSEWAKLAASPLGTSVSASGETAYVVQTDWKLTNPYSGDVQVTRSDLKTNQQTPLTYRVPLDDKDAAYHRGVATALDARDTIRFATELPGEQYLICATMTMPKFGCRLDIVDRDLNRLFSLQGNAWVHLPQATADGKRLYFMGNTLQVWDAQTGKRLASIRTPHWEKQNQFPLKAYLTPDGTQAAIITYLYNPKSGPDLKHLTAYLYRLSDGKLLNSFAVKP